MAHFVSHSVTESNRFDIKVDVYAYNVEIDALTSLHNTNFINYQGLYWVKCDTVSVQPRLLYSLVNFGKQAVYLILYSIILYQFKKTDGLGYR